MNDEERTALLVEKMLEEADEPIALWWLSFVDTTTKSAPPEEQVPGGGGFLGVAIVRASGPVMATARAHRLGINPGGEVGIFGPFPLDAVEPEFVERPTLLTAAEAEGVGAP